MLIPKVLHYVWLGRQSMHPLMDEWRERWASLHPGWEVKVWRESPDLPPHLLACGDQLLECRHPAYLASCPTYSKRSDVWRYDILEQLGGVYLDTDFEPIKCLEPILKGVRAFAGLVETRYGWSDDLHDGKVKIEVGCSLVGTVPHSPLARDLVEGIPRQDAQAQLSLAFPYLTEVVARHKDAVRLFSPDVFYPVTWDRYALGGRKSLRKEALSEATYAVHRWSSCWFSNSLKKLDAR